ncbi:MAG: hypothetical protein MJ151_04755, partial [Lachnospiraceae bacterium]|nr:hypothetical protein [Lachnospiraceae bacterium]
ARLRLMDSDFQRVERQKKVIALCLEKAKTLDFNTIMGIAISIIPTISYNFDWAELTSLVKSIDGIHIVESTGFPSNKYFTSMKMGSSGDCVIPNPLNKAVVELHQLLYDDNEYSPSKSVNGYSGRIIELKEKYAEENRIEASRIAREKEEEEIRKTMPKISTASNTKKRKATSSTITKKVNPFNNENDVIVEPIIAEEYDDYEDEPESDDVQKTPFAPKTSEKDMSPKSPNNIQDVNAPYNSSTKDKNAPYSSDSKNENINEGPVSPIGSDRNLPSEVTAPPGVNQSEKETTVNMPISPINPISGGIVAPPISGEPDQAVNSGPPIS